MRQSLSFLSLLQHSVQRVILALKLALRTLAATVSRECTVQPPHVIRTAPLVHRGLDCTALLAQSRGEREASLGQHPVTRYEAQRGAQVPTSISQVDNPRTL